MIAAQERDPVADRIEWMFERQNCLCVREHEERQLNWLVSVRRPAAVLVLGSSGPWLSSVISSIRPQTSAAIVVIGHPLPPEVVRVLAVGADAVVADDTYDDEILARVAAVTRRTSAVEDPGVRYLDAGNLRVDLWDKRVSACGERLALSPTEYRLLVLLMRNSGRAVSTSRLIQEVWGWSESEGLNTLRIFIARLRRKLTGAGLAAQAIESVRSVGYRFAPPVLVLGADENLEVHEQALLIQSAAELVRLAAGFTNCQAAATYVVNSLVSDRIVDSSAILRVSGRRLEVVAHFGQSQAWCDAVCPSIPLDPRYASVRALKRTEVAVVSGALVEGSGLSQTITRLSAKNSNLGIFIPILAGGTRWGTLGAGKAGQVFSAATIAYLELVAALFGTALAPALHDRDLVHTTAG